MGTKARWAGQSLSRKHFFSPISGEMKTAPPSARRRNLPIIAMLRLYLFSLVVIVDLVIYVMTFISCASHEFQLIPMLNL